MTSSSMRLSFAGKLVDWMTKMSSPRTFSWISTNTSMSAKRRTTALVNGTRRYWLIASQSALLLLPARSFMAAASS